MDASSPVLSLCNGQFHPETASLVNREARDAAAAPGAVPDFLEIPPYAARRPLPRSSRGVPDIRGTVFPMKEGKEVAMRIETRELGVELKREGRVYLEYAVFGALRQFVPQVDLVNVCLRRAARQEGVICVMAAELVPEGKAVVVQRALHPYAAIDRAAADLRHRIAHTSEACLNPR